MNKLRFAVSFLLAAGCAKPPAAAVTTAPRDAPSRPGPPGPSGPSGDDEGPDGAITAAEQTAAVDALTAALATHYVFPEKAAAIARALHDRLRRGDYAAITSAQAFARTLTEDMAALVHDKHLQVRYVAEPIPPGAGESDEPSAEMQAEEAAEMRYNNYGIFEVRRIRFNIGYLNVHLFGRPSGFAEKIAAAMRLVHDTQSLVVDLRDCHGGDTEAVTLAQSYLVPAKTHLIDMYVRSTNTTDSVDATTELEGPRYPADAPVFILVGEDTVSGCEAFAYGLQAQQRATVIGSPTAGAAYFGGPRRLTDHFMAFVPVGRPIDPITHGDWEGTGVAPQIIAAPDQALDVAERESLELLEAREPAGRRKAAMRERLAELK